jgi:hypothetical protein
MSRLWQSITVRALAASTASGVGATVLNTASYFEGQLLIKRTAAGAGGYIRPIWQVSADGATGWADLSRGATMNGVGVGVMAVSNLGLYFRPKWPSAKNRVKS